MTIWAAYALGAQAALMALRLLSLLVLILLTMRMFILFGAALLESLGL